MKQIALMPLAWLLALVLWIGSFRITKVLLVPPFLVLMGTVAFTIGLVGVAYECWNRNCWPWQAL